MAGLFDLMNPETMGALSMASGLMQAGGPSRTPVPFGTALGSAFQNAQRDQQQQALINLEQQKGALTAAQVAQAQYQLARQNWALNGMQGPMPAPPTLPNMPGMPQQQFQQQFSQPPQQGPIGDTQPAPMQGGAAPQLPQSNPLSGVPSYLAQAAQYKMAGLPEIGSAIEKANEPIVGREGGLFQRGPNGLQLDPGWLRGEEQRKRQSMSIENENTIVDVPMADGRTQKMTKAQALSLTAATNQIVNAVPGLNAQAISSIQRQLAAEPDKPVNIDITLGGRQAKLTLQPLGGQGFASGQTTEARSAQEKSGTNAGDVQQQIDQEATGALQSRKILGEMRTLSQDFTPGKVAPFKRALGEWAQALKLPGNWSEEIKAAESQQALQKLTAQMATAAMKQFTNRGTQMEFKTFLANNPNAELIPGGFQKVLEFMDSTANASLQKQQAYVEWRKTNNVERSQDFLAEWNKKQNAELAQPANPSGPAAPKKGDVVDGWEFIGGDPGQRMNWRKK